MEKSNKHLYFLVFLTFLSLVVSSIAENEDKYWQKRRDAALLRTKKAHRPDFFNITNLVNSRARKMFEIEGARSIRRMMDSNKKYDSACEVTNPIDSCWRCQANWAKDRHQLATCPLGFGKHASGGSSGKLYVVTDPSDNDVVNPKEGTLRYAVILEDSLWITFSKDMNITLKRELLIYDQKTIDGRGARVVIQNGPGFTIPYVNHVIIHGIEFRSIVPGPKGPVRDSANHIGERKPSAGNAISIQGSQNVWIDHCTFTQCKQSFIDVHDGSTGITVSNCRMFNQDEVFVFGAQEKNKDDLLMQVTIAYNHFGEKLNKSMPMCSNGICHLVSNDYTTWGPYAVACAAHVTIISQGNRFIAPDDIGTKLATTRIHVSVPQSGQWRGERDLFLNGASFEESGHLLTNNPYKQKRLRAMPGMVVSVMSRHAGPLKCVPDKIC